MGLSRYPGAVWNPGAAAGYRNGRNRMEVAICHYTVGVNSTPIGLRGYFHFLVGRDGTIQQFCEVDGVAWHAGQWNDAGPGVEVEYHPAYHDQIFNQPMRDAAKGLVHWLNAEHGFPLDKYEGERISEFAGFRGFIDHGDLIQSEQHTDYWPQSDWDYIAGDNVALSFDDLVNIGNTLEAVDGKDLAGKHVGNLYLLGELIQLKDQVRAIASPRVDVNALATKIVAALPVGVAVDPKTIAQAVRDEFAARPLT